MIFDFFLEKLAVNANHGLVHEPMCDQLLLLGHGDLDDKELVKDLHLFAGCRVHKADKTRYYLPCKDSLGCNFNCLPGPSREVSTQFL